MHSLLQGRSVEQTYRHRTPRSARAVCPSQDSSAWRQLPAGGLLGTLSIDFDPWSRLFCVGYRR